MPAAIVSSASRLLTVTSLAIQAAAADAEAVAVADLGDAHVLDQAARHLVRAARAVERQLDFAEAFPLVLAGGAFKACPSLYDRVEKKLDLELARVVRLEAEPATGAVTLALELLE